jgi:hypothetical protein
MLKNLESGTMCCIRFAPNLKLCIQDKKGIALPHFLQYYFSAVLQKDACFGIF